MNWYVHNSCNPMKKAPLSFKYMTIYLNVKGHKHGNPPDMVTIFFETRKDNKFSPWTKGKS